MRLRRLCMDQNGGEGGGGADDSTKTVPLAALQAERAARAAASEKAANLEKRLADIEAANKAADEDRAAKAGEHKQLYDALKPEHDKATARLAEIEKAEKRREERFSAKNKDRLAALPDAAQKALKPISGTMSAEDFADYLDEHAATFGAVEVSAGTRRADGRKAEEAIPADASADWQKFGKHLGVSERDWYEKNWKPRQKAKKP